MFEIEFLKNYQKQYIKFDDVETEYKALAEFACEVCMAKKRGTSSKYGGCALRMVRKEYCPEIARTLEKFKSKG